MSMPASISITSSHTEKIKWFRGHFRPHFDGWILHPIYRLVPSQDALIGFIFIACAIDYLAGFWWGKQPDIRKGEIKQMYTGFIDGYFAPGRYDAEGLYDSLRNGLVHMFTIKKKKYALIHDHPEMHLKTNPVSGYIVLNAENFRDDFVSAKEQYFDDVEATPDLLDRLVDRYTRDGFLSSVDLEVA